MSDETKQDEQRQKEEDAASRQTERQATEGKESGPESNDQTERGALTAQEHKAAVRETWSQLDAKSIQEAGATLHQAEVTADKEVSGAEYGGMQPGGHGDYDRQGFWRSRQPGSLASERAEPGEARPLGENGLADAKANAEALKEGEKLYQNGVRDTTPEGGAGDAPDHGLDRQGIGRKRDDSPKQDQEKQASEAQENGERPALSAAKTAAEQTNQEGGYHYLGTRRAASEAAAQETMGKGATNLDTVTEGLGHRGNNFPTYDLSSNDEVTSVKSHWNERTGELTDQNINAYKADFRRVTQSTEKDGANLVAAGEKGVDVPEGIGDASPEQAAEYLRSHATLRVPDDHVMPARAAVENEARKFPENYGLQEHPSEAEIAALGQRIQGIGVTSQELRQIDEEERNQR